MYLRKKIKLCTTQIVTKVLNRAFANYLVGFLSDSHQGHTLCTCATSINVSRLLGVGIGPCPFWVTNSEFWCRASSGNSMQTSLHQLMWRIIFIHGDKEFTKLHFYLKIFLHPWLRKERVHTYIYEYIYMYTWKSSKGIPSFLVQLGAPLFYFSKSDISQKMCLSTPWQLAIEMCTILLLIFRDQSWRFEEERVECNTSVRPALQRKKWIQSTPSKADTLGSSSDWPP